MTEEDAPTDLLAARERIAELEAENARLHERLEDNHEYELVDGEMKRLEVATGTISDGIECREATIDILKSRIAELESERDALAKEIHSIAVDVPSAKARFDALMAASKALLNLHAYIDFDEPLTPSKPMVFDDPSGVNVEFRGAYEAVTALRAAGIELEEKP